jgi:hypothetical protein
MRFFLFLEEEDCTPVPGTEMIGLRIRCKEWLMNGCYNQYNKRQIVTCLPANSFGSSPRPVELNPFVIPLNQFLNPQLMYVCRYIVQTTKCVK